MQFSTSMAMSKALGLVLNSTTRQTFLRMSPSTAQALRFMKRDKTYKMLSRSRIRRGRGMGMAMSGFRESASSSSADVEIDEALNQLSDEIDETLQNLSVPVEEEEKAEFWDGQQAGGAEEEENRERRRKEVEEAINKVLDEDLDEAVDKYDNLGHELYAKIDFAWINAFAERAFGGNPAVVCYLPYETESEWMQLVAREFNVSETAFLVRRRASNSASKFTTEKTLLEMDGSGKALQPVTRYFTPPPPKNVFYLRWFTPKVEVEVPSSGDVKLLKPHFEKMLEFEGHGGLIVTSAGEPDSEFDFISRYFCPKAGVTEDPVTGSAHCALGPYWADKLQKDTLEAYQASERGGRVHVKVNKVKGRVSLQGSAVLVMMGTLVNSHSVSS
uniref:Oxidoreductase n=1 Tax=Araucaria cunninghamii TaxID=56994 RepID=A0A0D6R209_ARACU